jgi:hypothetical protein
VLSNDQIYIFANCSKIVADGQKMSTEDVQEIGSGNRMAAPFPAKALLSGEN